MFIPQERTIDWQQRFGGALGLTCRELTGDSEDLADLNAADIICITPEKFDALTRKHKDQGGMSFFGEVEAPPLRSITLYLCSRMLAGGWPCGVTSAIAGMTNGDSPRRSGWC